MQRRNRAQWREIVSQWKASGEPAKSFASRKGLNAGTMKWWSYRLRAEESEAAKHTGGGELVEVIASEPGPTVEVRPIALRLAVGSNIAMVFEQLPGSGYLADFVRAIERTDP